MPPRPRSSDNEVANRIENDNLISVQQDESASRSGHRPINTKMKKRKIPVFGDSGLTDSERRELRLQQRQIAARLRDNCEDLDEIEHQRSKNNALFMTKVCYTREAVLDADNLDLIVDKYSKHIAKNVQVARYDACKLAQKLVSKCCVKRGDHNFFDWNTLGKECGVCYNAIPDHVSFLAGSLESQMELKAKMARKPRQKESVDESKEEEPEAVKNSKADADQLSAAEKNMKHMKQVLKNCAREQLEKNGGTDVAIDGISFLFNPNSFTQTVENIFNFSFLIKKGDAEIGVHEKMGLYVKPTSRPSENEYESESTCPTQAVVSFTMRDWRRIVEEHGLSEGILPHRTGSKHTKSGI